jgi:hypothetical protein
MWNFKEVKEIPSRITKTMWDELLEQFVASKFRYVMTDIPAKFTQPIKHRASNLYDGQVFAVSRKRFVYLGRIGKI